MKKLAYLVLLATLALSTTSCGKRTDAYYSTESQEVEVNGTAASRKETADKELLTVSDIEKLDIGKYVELGNYKNVYDIPDGALDDTGGDKEDYENRKKIVDSILSTIVENSKYTDIESLIDQKNTELLVQAMNAATDKKETLSEYAAELGLDSEEKLKENIQVQAEATVKQELVVYALAKELQITVSDQQYTEKAEDLAGFQNYASVQEMIDALGTERIRYDIISYTSVGIATKLISENGKKIQINEHRNQETSEQNSPLITDEPSAENGPSGSENSSETEETSETKEIEKTEETENTEGTEEPSETETPSETEEPSGTETPSESEENTDIDKTSDTEEP